MKDFHINTEIFFGENALDRLAALRFDSVIIISEEARGQFLCEFHNIDRFLCAILTARSGIRIIEPSWLRDKLLHMAQKAIDNNS